LEIVLAIVVIAGAVVLMSAPTTTATRSMIGDIIWFPTPFSSFDRGLNIIIQSAQIGSDGTISTDFQIADVPRPGRHPNRWT